MINIYISTYNRRVLLDFVLDNINKYKGPAKLILFDDYSNEFDPTSLKNVCDLLIIGKENRGPKKLRILQLEHFIKSEADYLYFTDSDTIHDKNFINILLEYHKKYNGIITLYNSPNHTKTKDFDEYVHIKEGCPGNSMFMNKKQAIDILKNSGIVDKWESISYDWLISFYVKLFYTTTISYCEHLGFMEGIHCTKNEMAINPTPFLINEKNKFMEKYK